jgi:hypothetical protein
MYITVLSERTAAAAVVKSCRYLLQLQLWLLWGLHSCKLLTRMHPKSYNLSMGPSALGQVPAHAESEIGCVNT